MSEPRPGDILELDIKSVVYGGFGLAYHGRIVVFVRRAYPGEVVKAKIYRRRRTALFADAVEILRESEFRRDAPCPVFGECGGCAWQDLDPEKQFEYKRDSVVESLERIGGLENIPEPEEIRAEREFHYRNKMELSFGEGPDGPFIGQHRRGHYNELVPAADCLLMPECGANIARSVENSARKLALRAHDRDSDSGLLRHLILRFSETEGSALIGLTLREPDPAAAETIITSAMEENPELAGGFMVVNDTTGDSAFGEVTHIAGAEYIEEDILGLRFRISLQSFFQTNTAMARKFYSSVADFAGDVRGAVFDLYSGTGTIAQILAGRAKKVFALEESSSAVRDGIESARRNGVENVEFIRGRVKKGLPPLLEEISPELVVFDPPRAGVGKKSLKRILENPPPAIVYASCNPTTLARDIEILGERYRLARLAVVDMFPQTHHIESVTRLKRRDQ